jgi:hypothetical protein
MRGGRLEVGIENRSRKPEVGKRKVTEICPLLFERWEVGSGNTPRGARWDVGSGTGVGSRRSEGGKMMAFYLGVTKG